MIYRIEIRKDGSVVSCTEVESALKDGGRIFYIDAASKIIAIDKARLSFVKWQEKARQARLARDALGLCRRCGEPGQNTLLCATCQAKSRATTREVRSIEKLPVEEAAAAIAARRERIKTERKRRLARARSSSVDRLWDSPAFAPKGAQVSSVLRRCLFVYDRDPANFRAWLLQKLDEKEEIAEAAE